MLPIYRAQSFTKILTGGTTKPWLVIVLIENQPLPYVVKLYKKAHIDQTNAVAKDVYSSILATRFGLNTPKPALIEFTPEFINSLPIEIKDELSQRDARIKFGCEFIDGSYAYVDSSHRDSLKKYDIENIYVFDNLIKNGDRNINKPNILLKGTQAYLIDHELTLAINQYTITAFHDNKWIFNKENHIFYNYLRNSGKNEKQVFFEDFSNRLTSIDFNLLDAYSKQLIALNHENDENYSTIKSYLCVLQQNSKKFVNLVKGNLG